MCSPAVCAAHRAAARRSPAKPCFTVCGGGFVVPPAVSQELGAETTPKGGGDKQPDGEEAEEEEEEPERDIDKVDDLDCGGESAEY